MKLTEQMFQASVEIWKKLAHHPFVLQMATGALDLGFFKRYILIDYAYLKEYINVLAAAVPNTDTFEEAGYLAKHMNATVNETLLSHVPLMKKLGITDEEINLVTLPDVAREYTNFMQTVASNGKFIDCLSALLCCSWSYAYIAKSVLSEIPQATAAPIYGDWFSAYSSESYLNANLQLRNKVDEYGCQLNEAEVKKYIEIFKKCSLYELSFWDMLLK